MVVPDLSDRLSECNLFLTMETSSSGFNPLVATKKLYSHFSRNATFSKPYPAAAVGALVPPTSCALATLSGVYGIPQISSGSGSGGFDDKNIAPLFGRTITTAKGHAEANIVYMKSLGVTRMAIIYAQDTTGISFQLEMTKAASRHGIDITSFPLKKVTTNQYRLQCNC